MKAFLIDPFYKSVSEVEYDGNIETIHKLLDCRAFDVVEFNSNGDSVFVDDEGLFVDGQAFFCILGFHQPLAGKGLVLGMDEEGASTSPEISLSQLKTLVHFPSV